MAAFACLQHLALGDQPCSMMELLPLLDGHRDLKSLSIRRPSKTIPGNDCAIASAATTLPNLHTVSLLDLDTWGVFDFMAHLVLPEADTSLGFLFTAREDALVTTCVASA